MKKFVSVALALMLALTGVSALAEGAAFTPAETYEPGERSYHAGEVTLEPASLTGGSVTSDVWAGEEGKDYTDEKVYTYQSYVGGLTSETDWNPHTWETSDDSSIMDMINVGFYSFVLNSTGTGYSVIPEMAADYATDVTAEYVGKFGVQEGETAKAWRIPLNQAAVWENGEAITADDYIYSMQQLLNPKMLNRRADSYYAGDFAIVNAKSYLYSAHAGETGYDPFNFEDMQSALDAGADLYVDMWNFYGLQGCVDADGNECPQYVSISDEVLYRDASVDEGEDGDWVSAKDIYEVYFAPGAAYESYAADYVFTSYVIEAATWEEVGLVKVDEYTIDIILEKPLAEAAFYLPYNLSSTWLVNEELYEQCKTFYGADGAEVETEEESTSVTTNYCKTLETSIGYGPYTLTYFELDKQYAFSRNDSWYGYSDGKHLGQYQMDNYVVKVIADHSTAMMAFESGEIDEVSLQSDDMTKYASSSYIMYVPQSYTTKVSFNTDYAKLVERGTGSQILVIDNFRKGFALCIDRNEFATAYTAAASAGFGVLNYMYVYDPFTGETYRGAEPAMATLAKLYGLTWGEGGDYDTLDEAYAAMTGYDMTAAQEAMKAAGEEAVAAGIWDGESAIEIEFRVYNSDTIYVQMMTYFQKQLDEACKGSLLEGKVTLKMTADPDYYETNYSGGADVIFTTWGGASMAPFGSFYSMYCDAGLVADCQQMEYGFDTSAVAVTYTVDGEEITASLQDWALWLSEAKPADYEKTNPGFVAIVEKLGAFTDYSYATRCQFAAGVEEGILRYYTTTPIYYRNSAILHSQKYDYAVSEYVNLISFGGVQFMTFNYDDTEWAEYCANNTLVY